MLKTKSKKPQSFYFSGPPQNSPDLQSSLKLHFRKHRREHEKEISYFHKTVVIKTLPIKDNKA